MQFDVLDQIDKARLLLPLLNREHPLEAEEREKKFGVKYAVARQVEALESLKGYAETLDHERQDVIFQTPAPCARCNIDDRVEKCVSKEPVTVVQVGDHVTQEHVVGALPPQEDAQRGDIVKHGTLHDGGRIDKKSRQLFLNSVL